MRLRVVIIALLAPLVFAGCDTQPATNVTTEGATLNGKGGCSGTEAGTWTYQLRTAGTGSFANVGPRTPFTCPGAIAEGALASFDVTGLKPSTTYEFRIHTTLTNGSTMWFDGAGTQNGTAYDRFTTKALPTTATGRYAYRTETCGTNRGHGSNDVNGTMYGACGTKIIRIDAANRRLADIVIGTTAWNAVAVSPDAKYIYGSTGGRLVRLDRLANGSYARNATWAPKPFQLAGRSYTPVPRNVVTDEFGFIYISNAGNDPDTGAIAPTRILKYRPDGTVMTHFGEHNDDPGNPYAFFQNRGIAVSRDGRSIYVTSHLQGQVRRFDIQANGSYVHAQSIGRADTSCASSSGLAAPSDVAVDPWGYVYIPDTTCKRIKKFDRNGAFVEVIATGSKVVHEIGVNRRGDVFAGEWNMFYMRTASNPVPGPLPSITQPVIDVTAPVLTRITLPATVSTNDVALAVTASDAVGIAQARVANEDGNFGPWKAYANPLPHALSAGPGYKVVYLQVRDAAGNESQVVATSTQVVVPPPVVDTVAPTLTALTVPASTTSRTISVTITATDNVGVTHMRFANEDGNWGAWKAFAPTSTHTLSSGYSTKGVYVQVMDAAGNESTYLYRTLAYVAA